MLGENPNKVKDVSAEQDGSVTTTFFEQACDAWAYSIISATYPSDTRQRLGCVEACAKIGVDYIDAVARAVEKLAEQKPEGAELNAVDMTAARFWITNELGQLVHSLRQQGAETRESVLSTGQQANYLGLLSEPGNDDEYGSLA